jgi:peptidyl-prolyl cis-trans isomerase SurA
MIRTAVLLVFCCAIVLQGIAQSNKKATTKPLTLFSVNKKPVDTDEFIYLYKKNHQHAKEDFTKDKIEEYLTLYVNFKLKVEEARKRGMDTTKAFLQEFNQYKEELRKPYLPGNNLTDSLVKMTYDRMKEEVRAAHLLISLKPDASPADTLAAYNRILDIQKKIASGEEFSALATALSEDPSARINKGDLGYFTAMQMVYPFENAAFSTPVGQVSKPVRTRFGYHLLKVIDRRPARGEVEVSHIMLRTGEDKNNEQAKQTIFKVVEELQGGVKWEDVCKQYSEDPGTKDTGGRLRPFAAGMMANVPEFERVAFELEEPGEISDPFQTQYGWHIIRLERKIPLAPFSELGPNLKNRINRDERAQISRQGLQTRLRKEMQFTDNQMVLKKIMELADTTLQRGNWNPVIENGKETLFTLREKPVTTEEFISFVKLKQAPTSSTPQKYLEELYNNFVDESILVLMEKDIAAKHPDYRYLLNEYYEGILLFEIMEKEVWNKASEDSVGQHRYYTSNASKYTAEERIRGTFYSAAKEAALPELETLLNEGDAKKIQEYVSRNKIKSESGYYKKQDKAVLQTIPWQKGIHSAQNNEMFYLAWIKEILPAGQMNFEEARPTIVSDYQNYLEAEWVARLRKKYPVKINAKGKAYILKQLQSEGGK